MLYLIANRRAGEENGIAAAVGSCLSEAGIPYTLGVSAYAGHATELAREYSAAPDCTGVVAIGGDGTFNEVLDGLDLRVPLGLVPAGSGNDFLRLMPEKKTLEDHLAPIIAGTTRSIDFLTVNDRRCLNVAGTGFDVDILLRRAKWKKRLPGPLSYWAALLVTVFHLKFRHVSISVDGSAAAETEMALLDLANGRFYGGGMPASPGSEIDDGLLDLLLIRRVPFFRVPDILFCFLTARLKEGKYVVRRACETVSFTIDPPVPLQVDGELIDAPTVVCRVHKGELRLFA